MRLTLLFALLVFPAFADEKPKPNTLTAKEIADGWIMLFDGETTFGWKVDGEAKVRDGHLVVGGEKATTLQNTSIFKTVVAEITYPISDSDMPGRSRFTRDETGSAFDIAGVPNCELHVTNDGVIVIRVVAGKSARLMSIKCKPDLNQPLFNTKDLTGWKTYDPAKAKAADPKAKEVKVASKYTVTKEGWLNVKDGGGDLQTEGQWADFVLQFECISNGKHLNSGMFFRCIPDLYQQGYEAQIRNEWMGDDRTKPVDFGTGAIYRRQPARKVVSTDGEWFTMTVAAHGRHIATWVNGYQTVDWTDDRKEADNARQGFKKSKGALSIQGHDPTTDLSFRNIRIQSPDAK